MPTVRFLLLAALLGCNRPALPSSSARPDAAASLSAVGPVAQPVLAPPRPTEIAEPSALTEPDPKETAVIVRRVKAAATSAEAMVVLLLAADDAKLSYAQIKKNPERYKGTPWAFTGRILEVEEKEGLSFARVALDYYANNVVYVMAYGESPFTEGDVVDVLGISAGSETYTSQAGWNITIPSIVATGLAKRGELAKMRKIIKQAKAKAGIKE